MRLEGCDKDVLVNEREVSYTLATKRFESEWKGDELTQRRITTIFFKFNVL